MRYLHLYASIFRGLMSMGNLCNASEPRKRALMSLGLGPSLVHALRTHDDSPGVQQWYGWV